MSSTGASEEGGTARLREALKSLEDLVTADSSLSDADRAEGYLFIAGLYKWGVDRAVGGADPDRPRFIRFMDTFSKWGLGNPDNLYLVAEIDSSNEYLIRGERGTCIDLLIEVRTGIGRREDDVHSQTLSFIDAAALKVEPDGKFELRLGGEFRSGNHLALPPDATTILARLTFADWLTETVPLMTIERVGGALPPVARPSLGEVNGKLRRAGDLILALGQFNDLTGRQWRASMPVNEFPAPTTKVGEGFFPGQHSSIGQFNLRDAAQALVVTLQPFEARYMGFSVGHLKWYQTLDYHNRQCSLNTAQARRSSDGRYHFVISSIDPGVPNWIDTGGHSKGFMFFRCQGLKAESFGRPAATLIDVCEVGSLLPADEPRISAEERWAILRNRQVATHRRFAY